jgi:hypothetical protein
LARLLGPLFALLIAVAFAQGPAEAAKRVALVIGNSAYKSAPALKNPRNDADGMAAALSRLGFQVLKGTDVDQFNLKALVRSFSQEIDTASMALFFYAGHGLQVNGKNYLIPVDAALDKEADLDFEAMDMNFILRQLERKDRTNIVLLDACRNNPLSTGLSRAMGERSVFVGRGLARVETGVGTFIGFATQPDFVALDGEGQNSPFTEALLKHIETPGLDIELLMRRVREDVISSTQGKQVPWSNSSLVGEVVLKVTPAAVEAEKAPEPAVQAPAPQPPQGASREIEIAYWNSVKDSNNPTFLRTYIEAFPKGVFAQLARVMIDDLEARVGQRASEPADKPASEGAVEPAATPPAPEEPAGESQQPAETPAQPEEQSQPPPKKKVVTATPPTEPPPKLVRPPVVEKKKRVEKKRIVPEAPVKKKVRVQPAPRVVIEQSSPAPRCGYCFPNGMKSFGRRWMCGFLYQNHLASGDC